MSLRSFFQRFSGLTRSQESEHWRAAANASDARAKQLKIDPPRPGRKTYAQRYNETSAMSESAIRAKIAEREAEGKECGVLYRVLSEKLRE